MMRRLGDLVTVKEAAAIKGVTVGAVRARIVRDGPNRLPAEKIGDIYFIKRRDLDRWKVQERRQAGEQE
jgi:hypothetical protein